MEKNHFTPYKEYKYLYETHLHTSEASACGQNSGAKMAEAAKEYGYTGIIVTEHNWGGNTCVPQALPWDEWVDYFIRGYKSALCYGKQHDLDVFWGYEAGYNGTEFLLYGISPEWLKAHPQMRTASVGEQYELIHEAGGMVVHAHPYREEWYIPKILLFPDCVDAVEGVNATHSSSRSKHHNDPMFDKRAIAYANKHKLLITAGSDVHSVEMLGGGVVFRKRLTSIHDYIAAIKSGEYVLTNGEQFYDCHGNEIH